MHTASRVLVAIGWLAGIGLAATANADAGAPPGDVAAHIEVQAAPGAAWRVLYRFGTPVRDATFARSTDDSRTTTWGAPPEFEIVRVDGGELVRRRDGGRFDAVELQVPATYRVLPEDYAPFAPFGDGSLLFHTGRLFACAHACADDAAWTVELRLQGWRRALVDGDHRDAPVTWRDGGDGRYVYVGDTRPLLTPQLAAVLDGALPEAVRAQLLADLPRFMQHFAAELGALDERPMLFASYDTRPQAGRGRQGGVLPGQVSVHFYGAKWPEQMAKPGFGEDLAWHFAHEAAHLYQRQLFVPEDAWIHEGSAEAFAALALRAADPAHERYVAERIAAARTACANALGERSIRDAIVGGAFVASYDCGLVVSLAIHDAVRRSRPGSDGLYGVWRAFIADAAPKPAAERANRYLDAIAREGGAELADWVRKTVREPRPTLGAAP